MKSPKQTKENRKYVKITYFANREIKQSQGVILGQSLPKSPIFGRSRRRKVVTNRVCERKKREKKILVTKKKTRKIVRRVTSPFYIKSSIFLAKAKLFHFINK